MDKIILLLKKIQSKYKKRKLINESLKSMKVCLLGILEVESYPGKDDEYYLQLYIDFFDRDVNNLNKVFIDKYRKEIKS